MQPQLRKKDTVDDWLEKYASSTTMEDNAQTINQNSLIFLYFLLLQATVAILGINFKTGWDEKFISKLG